jgi:hypothetical protein
VDHRGHPEPGGAERPEVVGRILQSGRPQHVLLEDDRGVGEARREQARDRRLPAAARPGEGEQRQPPERLPMSALLADQHRGVTGDDRLVGPGSAGDADLQVDRCDVGGAQPNSSPRKLSRRLCPLCPYGGGESL